MQFFDNVFRLFSNVASAAGKLFTKDDLTSLVSENTKFIKQTAIPSIDSLRDVIKSSSHDYARRGWINREADRLSNNVSRSAKWNNNPIDILGNIRKALSWFVDNQKLLTDVLESGDEEVITSDGMSLKKATVVKIIDHMIFLSNFSVDFVDFVAAKEADDLRGQESKSELFIKGKVKEMFLNASTFGRIAAVYATAGAKIKKDVEHMPDTSVANGEGGAAIIYQQATKDAERKMKSDLKVITSNFNGNPLYHLGMLIVDIRVAINNWRKDRKQLLELRLMELRSLQENNPDPKLEKQIAYYEQKVAEYDYEIRKFEGTLDDAA